jgi:formate dehydrogenase alpha subunit
MGATSTDRSVKITVDGREVGAPAGAILLDVLRRLGVQVPTLCHDERLTPYGGCRLCVVARRDGRPGLVPSCSTPVQAGMIVETDTPEVRESRLRQLQLLVLDHRMECPVCERRGDCRFQDLIYEYGADEELLPFDRVSRPRDEKSPVIVRDPEKCILCGKCVRLCDEVQGVAAIGVISRGLEARVTTMLEQPLDCEFCGQCVNSCPVAALVAEPYVSEVPVWLRRATSTTCSYCSCGCQISVETYEGSLQRVTSDPDQLPNRGKLCVKGWLGYDVSANPERVTQPLLRKNGRLEEVGWDEALEATASALRDASAAGGPVVGIGSARLTCEDAYLMQRFMRSVVGTPHVDVGPVGGERALVEGMAAVMGRPHSTATFDDLSSADLVLVLRGDPTRTHPLVKTELVQGIRQRGQQLVLAHALSGGLERHAALYLPVEPATEEVLLNGVASQLLARRPGIASVLKDASGFGSWSASLDAYTPEVVSSCTGVPREQIEDLVDRVTTAQRVVIVVVGGVGIPGDESIVTRAAATLMALLETDHARGGGVLVLGEKANVQGVVDVGLYPSLLPGHRSIDDPDARKRVEDVWGASFPAEAGWHAHESFKQALNGNVGVLYLAGQAPVGTWPRGYMARDAVGTADFVVVHDAFLTQTARMADVVFPIAVLGEREGSLVGADGVRRIVRRVQPPPGSVPQDGQIFGELARRLGKLLPAGPALEEEITRLVIWPHRRGVARLFEPVRPPVHRTRWSGILLDASPQLFHSGSITTHSRLLQELSPSVAVRLAPSDAARLGVKSGEMVRVKAGKRELLLRARLDQTVRPNTLVVLWHGKGDSAATLMVDDGQPTAVEVRRSQ